MRVIFFGTPDFAVSSLEAVHQAGHEIVQVVAQPDRPQGRGLRMHSPPTAQTARTLGIPVDQPSRLRDQEFLSRVTALKPDLGIVVAYGKILPQSLLEIPRAGFVNVHASLLPKYRGAAPIQRAIEAGETETGVTIMRVDAELDHGPTLAMELTEIGNDERASSLSARLASLGAMALTGTLSALEAGSSIELPQDHAQATYARKIEREEGRVSWQSTAKQLYDRFRAFDPWPGLFVDAGGELVKLLDVTKSEAEADFRAGTIARSGPDSVAVATSKGILEVRQLQRPGKKPTHAVEYLRFRNLNVGDHFE